MIAVLRTAVERLRSLGRGGPERPAVMRCLTWLYLIEILVPVSLLAFTHPILVGDTDLWYHLAGGRYILQQGQLPQDSFFSFLAPSRPWVDYYWLFQVAVYGLYRAFQYQGIVVARAILGLGIVTAVLAYLGRSVRRTGALAWVALIGGLYLVALQPRLLSLRPHLFSYLLIAVFLWVLEWAPRRSLWLAPLAVLWVNLHGIMYPLMWLILGAYALEALADRRRRAEGFTASQRAVVTAGAACLMATLATPHGFKLLSLPWRSTLQASGHIYELAPVNWGSLLSFHIQQFVPSNHTWFTILLWMAVAGVLLSALKRSMRLSHLILFIGGLCLLPKGERFLYECAFLALPVLAANPVMPGLLGRGSRRLPPEVRLTAGMATAALLSLPISWLLARYEPLPSYPLSRQGLPAGVCAFLNQADAGGDVLNFPNTGGYLQWRLHPRYRIFMDMQTPFLFRDEDMVLVSQAFSDAGVLRGLLARYQPSFIVFPIRHAPAPELVKGIPEYAPVFFDDAEVLYAHRRLEGLVQRHELKALEPFALGALDADMKALLASSPWPAAMLEEAQRMLAVDPGCRLTNEVAARAFLRDGAFDLALPHAQAVIESFPESAAGYRLNAEALQGLGRIPEAEEAYQLALRRLAGAGRLPVLAALGAIWLELGKDAKAYRALRAAVTSFESESSVDDWRRFGTAARRVGRFREAEQYDRLAAQRF